MLRGFFRLKKVHEIDLDTPITTESPLISIVISAYNEEKYIAKLLESIKIQNYKNFEVIVVDDNSEDETINVAKKFETDIPLKVVIKKIRGVAGSRNYGADLSRGELILFLDADVILTEKFLEKNIQAFKKLKLSSAFVDFKPISHYKIDLIIAWVYRLWLKLVQYFNPRGPGFCLLIHRDLHKKMHFDETVIMAEDFDYVRRGAMLGKFRILTGYPVLVSWRRFEKERRVILVLKYLFFELHRIFFGEIRKKIIPYDFGDFGKN
jgi:glycosyltransferase involved in cell wall biosynthesis